MTGSDDRLSASDSISKEALELYSKHSFSSDQAYQQGVASVIASGTLEGKSDAEQDEILRKSRVFFFNRTYGTTLTVEEVALLEREDIVPAQIPQEAPPALSFAELKALIEQGELDQIPNNRRIPEGIHMEAPSESRAPVRKKPWEN
ncbi:hypothetical protein PUNSTDRAFT_130080 [Punctularia strigosozonata HHB-11173 SS5]|uniref:uncharacterized protein n=1 Tax=Punctularia strigosozonata (strain HHB-11173) TaxID=741275 RepID=UPI0004416C12|nr:uncharacterized protein PUNSTDRAFT_130080 [Punctularia strigosozonata HHB-11173 SS5]EIN14453.1 hypothetical protein PUNSTDRAFT_130080 [Punctularia strigosozonata HHB-11173 SS5]